MNKDNAQTSAALPPEIAGLSFEEALSELEKLVKQLEDGRAKLDEALGAYERGVMLKRHCETKLREAQAKIERISIAGEAVSAVPFET